MLFFCSQKNHERIQTCSFFPKYSAKGPFFNPWTHIILPSYIGTMRIPIRIHFFFLTNLYLKKCQPRVPAILGLEGHWCERKAWRLHFLRADLAACPGFYQSLSSLLQQPKNSRVFWLGSHFFDLPTKKSQVRTTVYRPDMIYLCAMLILTSCSVCLCVFIHIYIYIYIYLSISILYNSTCIDIWHSNVVYNFFANISVYGEWLVDG